MQYDPDGKNLQVAFPNGAQESRMYSPCDWLNMIQISEANQNIADTFQYLYYNAQSLYDPTGHIQQEVDAGNRVHAFSYDHLYQLVQEQHPDSGTYGYGYDANGNRISKTSSLGTDYYGVDAANKLLWVNRGTNAVPTSGQANPYTLFGYDLNGLLYDSNANAIYTPGFGQQVSGVDRYADQDWLGSTRYLSDGFNGNSFPSMLRFDAFGNRSATGGTDAYDSTDLQFAGGRGYQTEFASATEPGVGVQDLRTCSCNCSVRMLFLPGSVGCGAP
jgi:YD repeat-containing protein